MKTQSATLPRLLAYAWAAPNTAVGGLGGLALLACGGRLRVVAGTLEFDAGLASGGGFGALTLGHTILGRNAQELDALRAHERVHVGQYERWGPFFVPAYLLASLWQWSRGRHAYRDNPFERQAYAES